MTRILVTGACGFVGSHIIDVLTENWNPYIRDREIIALDSLTYAGRLDRIEEFRHRNVKFQYHDFRFPLSPALLKNIGPVDYIVHNGAETHVSRSFKDPRIFVDSNIIGTMNMLEAARVLKPKKFIYTSTDEVYGPNISETGFTETDALNPTNPYAAAKAGAEYIAYSYYRSFGVPVVITRTMNMFGEKQHPEKFIPLVIKKILNSEIINIHGITVENQWVSGQRCWLYVKDQARAIEFLLEKGIAGETYNISGTKRSNWFIANFIGDLLNHIPWAMTKTESDRPVHDFSYSVDDRKIRSLGWKPEYSIESSLKQTVEWTLKHREFLEE